MQYYVHISPTFDCLIKSQNLEVELNKNELHSFLVDAQKLNIIFYPLSYNQNSLPFCYELDLQDPICNNNVDAISYPNQNILLKVKPFFLSNSKSLNTKSKILTFANTTHTLFYQEYSTFNISLSNKENSSEYTYPKEITTLKFIAKNSSVFLYSKLKNSNNYLVCLVEFTQNSYVLKKLEEVEVFEQSQNQIETYKLLHDLAHHGLVTTYNLSSNFYESSNLVYESNTPILTKNKIIIPYAFFEAVKAKNYKLAKFYLSNDLSKVLTNKKLTEFFGEFSDITSTLSSTSSPNEISLIYTKQDLTKTQKYALNFFIEFDQNNKISNITQEENNN